MYFLFFFFNLFNWYSSLFNCYNLCLRRAFDNILVLVFLIILLWAWFFILYSCSWWHNNWRVVFSSSWFHWVSNTFWFCQQWNSLLVISSFLFVPDENEYINSKSYSDQHSQYDYDNGENWFWFAIVYNLQLEFSDFEITVWDECKSLRFEISFHLQSKVPRKGQFLHISTTNIVGVGDH